MSRQEKRRGSDKSVRDPYKFCVIKITGFTYFWCRPFTRDFQSLLFHTNMGVCIMGFLKSGLGH